MTDVPTPADPKDLLAIGLESASPGIRPGWIPPAPGDLPLIPNLEIGPLLGSGGMGAVYRARQTHLDRPVALKILDPARGADPAFAERFAREARAMARLDHPAIVRLYDYGQTGTWPWLVMELVEGANLREVIRTGNLSAAEALRIAPQLCEALAHAHAAGVVHRDLKPENILIDGRGRPHIADFGLAKLADAGGNLTATGQGCGTAVYMAPEQVAGAADVDHRADLYALGVILYEMLTGTLPLGRFAPPSQTAGVDKRLDEGVFKSLEREPGRRWQTADEVRQAVEMVTGKPEHVSVDLDWLGLHVRSGGKTHVALDEDGDEIVPPQRASRRLAKTGVHFLVGGVLLAGWLALVRPAADPALLVASWAAAAGLIIAGASLAARCWRFLAPLGGVAALLPLPCLWTVAQGFWPAAGVLALGAMAVHYAVRVFHFDQLDEHFRADAGRPPAPARRAAVLLVALAVAAGAAWTGLREFQPRPPTVDIAADGTQTVHCHSGGTVRLAAFTGPALPAGRIWHVRTRARWRGLTSPAWLESRQRFPVGTYVVQTDGQGAMAPLTGSSDDWREVVLPFNATRFSAELESVEVSLNFNPGPAVLEFQPFELVDGAPPVPVPVTKTGIRTIVADAAGRIRLADFAGTHLPTGRTWHLRSRIRWHDVQGQAMLESVQRFADGGAYVSRTLADRGPMASFTGSSDAWREVVLPFDASASAAALTAIEATLVMAGPGTVELEPFSLVEGLPR